MHHCIDEKDNDIDNHVIQEMKIFCSSGNHKFLSRGKQADCHH
jgi:hypothetical protein